MINKCNQLFVAHFEWPIKSMIVPTYFHIINWILSAIHKKSGSVPFLTGHRLKLKHALAYRSAMGENILVLRKPAYFILYVMVRNV